MTMPRRVAVLQLNTTPSITDNMDSLQLWVEKTRQAGADFAVVPEAFSFIGSDAEKQSILEPLPEGGPIFDRCKKIAIDNKCELILGGFHERPPVSKSRKGKQLAFNTSIHLSREGKILAMYRKIHMFDVELADGTQLCESDSTLAANETVVTQTDFGTIGLSICYDLRFPMLYQQLVDQGATVITVPSAFTLSTGKDHWHALLRARAIECQSYVLAAAQWGHHYKNRTSYGHAMIVDPWGCIIAECGEGPGIAVAEINPELVVQVREQVPSLKNRRDFKPQADTAFKIIGETNR
ncbi:MAG: carbon-nitrogen hydrolase family protein [Pseudomonadales bacterium]|nr:carbon-nitrogen hydrolase family protein [Pseudomonadales bacterium]